MGIEKNYCKRTFEFIEKGKSGNNKGFDFTITKLNEYIKIWNRTYYLYFALSGVGKSKWVYHQHIFNVIDQQIHFNKVKNLKIDLYSLEISPITVTAHLILFYLYKYKKIIADTHQIFSYNEKINEELYKIINSQDVKDYVNEAFKYLNIYTHLSIEDLIKNTEQNLNELGTIYRDEKGRIIDFEEKDTFLYEIIIDHYSLCQLIKGKSKYETISIISSYLFKIRDIAKITPVAVQQVNPDKSRSLSDTVSPSHEDLRDCKDTYNDSDVAIAIGSPFKHKIAIYPDNNGYKILPHSTAHKGLRDRFRFLEIRKNRNGGGNNQAIGTLFIGEISHYANIKSAADMTPDDYLKINNITKSYNN